MPRPAVVRWRCPADNAGVLVTALIARRPMRSVATAERSRIRERSVGSPLPTYRATAT
jgi:hypothetical protein